ncbi:MAG: DUF378 domain-containing protein [Nitrospirota bacterium]
MAEVYETNNVRKLNAFDWISLVLVIIGGINWGLIGLFRFDLVAALFGDMSAFSRIIYTLVGAGALYMLAHSLKLIRHPLGEAPTAASRRT